MSRTGTARTLAALVAGVLLLGCGAEQADPPPTSGPASSGRPGSPGSPSTPGSPGSPSNPASLDPSRESADPSLPGTMPPPWLGTRALPLADDGFGVRRPTPRALVNRRFTLPDTLAPLPGTGFASRTAAPAPRAVIARSTWNPTCPVAAADLAWVRLTFWGFDDRRHTGELLVNAAVAQDVVRVFSRLYRARFPIEEMRITTPAELDAAPTGDGNNTGSFSCRTSVGSDVPSQHAYGLAVDVNPFQNPYTKGDLLLPELAGAYVDRSRLGPRTPGVIRLDGPVVDAFTAIGWTWGGTWRTASDLHHFSQNGR